MSGILGWLAGKVVYRYVSFALKKLFGFFFFFFFSFSLKAKEFDIKEKK